MQKWEYLTVTFAWANKAWRAVWIGDKEVPDWKHGQVASSLYNQLGNQGWEMVTVNFSQVFNQFGDISSTDFFTTFKRPKE